MNQRILKGIFILLAASVVTGLIYNRISPNGIPLTGQGDGENGAVHAVQKGQDAFEIFDSDLVEQIIENKSRILIDVRSHDTYKRGHIPGALNFPLHDFEDNFQQMMRRISLDDPLLIYCSSIDCTDSRAFADILTHMNFTDVKIYPKGFRGWDEEGRRITNDEN